MSDTPRTDAESFPDFENGGDVVLAEFARALERELAQSIEANTGLMKACNQMERERDKMQTVAGELIAMICVNVMHGTFRDATIEQIGEHLKPWIEKVQSDCNFPK